MVVQVIVYFLLSVLGFVIGRLSVNKLEVDGLLNVDQRDSEKDYYDFVFLVPTGDIPKKKYLKIEVKTKN